MHKMKLNDRSFNLIKNGSKIIELRLNDEKRRLIKVNDIIEFTNRENENKVMVKVINLYKYNNFDDLYKCFDKIALGYSEGEVANSCDMEKYYSKEQQEKYGVLGIEIELYEGDVI